MTTPDIVTIRVNGIIAGGYSECEITRGIESFPSEFRIATSEKYNLTDAMQFKPGTPCQIYIGNDPIITGKIDSYNPSISATSHGVGVYGRGNGRELVDCSAFVNPDGTLNEAATQITSQNIFQVASTILKPFNISLSSTAVNQSNAVIMPAFIVNLGQTVYDVLEECARYNALLLYDDTSGNLILSQVGTSSHSSGFFPDNVQDISVAYDYSDRYTHYIAVYFAVDTEQDTAPGSNLVGVVLDEDYLNEQPTAFRPLVIQSEQVSFDSGNMGPTQPFVLQRANWEMKRRRGRSQVVRLTTDSWRDSAGTLWQPNYFVNVNYPEAKIFNQSLIISKVTYRKSVDSGTTAELELMTADAFTVEPISLVTELSDILQPASTNNAPSNTPVSFAPSTPVANPLTGNQ